MTARLSDVIGSRRWVCQVVRTGFHNGAHCRPDDPHGEPWNCGWRWEVSIPA